MSYKIIQNGEVVSVIDSPVWVTQLSNGSIIRSGLSNAMGVVSADGTRTFHIIGAKKFVNAGRKFEDVEAVYINAAEAEELKTLLELGASVSGDADVTWDEPTDEPEPETIEDNATLDEAKDRKIALLSEDSRQVIYNGVDVETTAGVEHFALGINEQLDLITLYSLASTDVEQIPYHNSDGDCRYYSGEDILKIISAANKLKMYHSAYMDSLKRWVSAMQSISEVGQVKYGDTIPDAYCTDVYRDIASSV